MSSTLLPHRTWALLMGFAISLLPAGSAAAQLVAPVFGPATPAAQLNTSSFQYPTQLLPGGLEIELSYLSNDGFKLESATRATVNSPFSAPSQAQFVNINAAFTDDWSGVISPNGLELFFGQGFGGTIIYRATRADTAQPFTNPVFMSGISGGGTIHKPAHISLDGLRLYIWNENSAAEQVYTRATLASSFGAGSSAPFANLPLSVEDYSLTSDELEIYYTYSTRLWWSRRPNLATPFAAGVEVTSVQGALGVFDGQTLFFQRNDGLIMQAPLITAGTPEPAAAALVLALAAPTLVARRRR